MGIYSAWPDGQWLGTYHPSGSPLVQPNLRLQVGAPLVVRAVLPALFGAALTALAAVLFVTLPR